MGTGREGEGGVEIYNQKRGMEIYEYSFEKLVAWKKAKELAIWAYQITKNFPTEEKYGLMSQMRRCGIGIPSHLAEVSGRITGKDKANFTSIAYSTLMELLNQSIISFELGFLSKEDYLETRRLAQTLSKMLNNLRNSQLKSA